MKEKKPLTKWEAGNELVRACDACGEAYEELKADWPELAELAKSARKLMADKFNAELVSEMGFGL